MNYPINHIEADNRLSWFLGKLDEKYGDSAYYVHLTRDLNKVARSHLERYSSGLIKMHDYSIINPYARNMIGRGYDRHSPFDLCLDYCHTVNKNINSFLKDKSNKIEFPVESSKEYFKIFWNEIGAQGNLEKALLEWDIFYNKNKEVTNFMKLKRKLKYLRALLYE